ncbi:hypothetical protein BC835DRAFT_216831 [Cytidiella melzeri]|nr:hypothetical protein BC835DRAFT_216831 [Cytidiella melzeri]
MHYHTQPTMEHIRHAPDSFPHRRNYAHYHPESLNPSSFSRTSSNNASRPVASPSVPRRSRTSAPQDYVRLRKESEPWTHMAKTYAWVMEQEITEMSRRNEESVQWIYKQQERDRRERLRFPGVGSDHRFYVRILDELDEAEDRHRQRIRGERVRLQTAYVQEELGTAIQDELHRLQAKRRESERCRAAYQRRKVLEEERERERRRQESEKAQRAEMEKKRWKEYEDRWSHITSTEGVSEQLTFATMPWPMLFPPRVVEDIQPARIAMFILSAQHSEGHPMKDRVKSALRRWHPDRFSRLLARVSEEDKEMVEEGAGIVARCLSNLLERA